MTQDSNDITKYARVVCVGPDLIQIEVTSTEEYQSLDKQLEIGSYLKISDDSDSGVVAIVQSYRIRDRLPADETELTSPTFVIDAQPVGKLEAGKFRRGGKQITIPPKHVSVAASDVLSEIYANSGNDSTISFGALVQDKDVRVAVDGDRFFGKHIGVVGSTGSGKSCTVARILQEGIKSSEDQRQAGMLNNSHIIIFDLHGEYAPAFPGARVMGVNDLCLPYWLMNSEELEEMFIESKEQNSHNQISQFRQAVIENKEMHAGAGAGKISYDSPVYFSLDEVINYLTNMNKEVVSKEAGESGPKLSAGTVLASRSPSYFKQRHEFAATSQAAGKKAGNGPFNGEFDRFLMRLEGRQNDKRLDFLLSPKKKNGTEYKTEDLTSLLEGITGYGESNTNVTIVDLSGIPFEVLSIVVSLMTRLIFTFSFNLKKNKITGERELPFLLVYEEAHNYVPQSEGAKYGSVKKSIERIAKEGRKYGVSLMIVSQRPSEISETVFSQCNNFVAMRLTNPVDQRYVKRLLPDNLGAITDSLPTLERQEVILIGDAVAVPSLIKIDDIEDKPASQDVKFHAEWKEDWLDVDMTEAISKWKG